MDVARYLKRIGFQGKPTTTLDTLRCLQKAHLMTVPFENLDIHIGRQIILDTDRIFEKVVHNNRGGFCYELNGIFHFLLKEIGFEVTRISARVFSEENGLGPEYDHLTNLVNVDGKQYLTEVGYGEFALFPLEFALGQTQIDPRGKFVFENHDDHYFIVKKVLEDKVNPEYLFTTLERTYTEYIPMCYYMQTHPDSHFVKKRLCTIPTDDGRITITGDTLKIKIGKETTEIPIRNDEHYNKILKDHFNIILD
ncbi:MAG: arylamine N-acetyltransferase [Bacteroidota bacterium]